MIKPDELRGAARESYDMWRRIGLSEQAALDSVIEDGLVQLDDHDKLARTLRNIFPTLTESQSLAAAARGHDSGSRPVSESLSSLRPDPANIPRVVAAIREIAEGLCREGIAEDKALREASTQVMLKVPDERTADWVARVAQRFGLI